MLGVIGTGLRRMTADGDLARETRRDSRSLAGAPPRVTFPPMGCIDPGELQAFVAGTLDPAGGERLEAHIDECADCRAVLAELARSSLVRAEQAERDAARVGTAETIAPGTEPSQLDTDETLPAGANAATIAPIRPSSDSKVVPGATV